MATGWLFHELYLWHDTLNWNQFFRPGATVQPGEHAEHPETKRRFRNLVEVSGLHKTLHPLDARPATDAELRRFHTPEYLAHLRQLSAGDGGDAGISTPMGHGSFEIAALAAGGAIVAADAVISGEVDNAYVLCRPPGHHALADTAMGFCLLGNAVIAIEHARAVHGLRRVAVLDWDVHHGNGTQSAYVADPDVLTLSIHQDSLFPVGSGAMDETGEGAGAGACINLPLPPGSGSGAYAAAMSQLVAPALRRFDPELIVVSCGFDASAMDPLAHMMLCSTDYRRMTETVMALAAELCGGRVLMLHEGGYSAPYVPYCGLAVLEALSGTDTGVADPWLGDIVHYGGQALQPHQTAAIEAAVAVHGLAEVEAPA